MFKPSAPLLIATVLTSCVAGPDTPDELGAVEQQAGCQLGQCGGNSSLLGPFKIPELEATGLPNKAKIRLLGYVKPGAAICTDAAPCQVAVVGDQLQVKVGGTPGTGVALVGGYLKVWQPGDATFAAGYARIHLSHWSKATTFWQGPGSLIETFQLDYEIPGVSRGPVCKSPPGQADNEGNQWPVQTEAVFFAGDRYDEDTMTVIASSYAESGNWFNIACAGSSSAKLHLNRHTTAGSTTGFTTTRKQRQAMLKMYTGDFCNTGTLYTVQGTKISWTSSSGLSGPAVTGINSFESVWDENGAVCMDHHRLASSTNPAEAALEGIIRNGYPATCKQMPTCGRTSTGYLRTKSAALP